MGGCLLIKVHRAGGELTEGTLFPEPLEQLRGTLTGMGVSTWPPSMITVPGQLEFTFGSQTDLLLNIKDQTGGGESTGATIFLELPAPHLETLTEIFMPTWPPSMITVPGQLEFTFGSQTDLLLNIKDQTGGGESTGATIFLELPAPHLETLTEIFMPTWPPSMITVPGQLEFTFGSQTDLLLNIKDQTGGGE